MAPRPDSEVPLFQELEERIALATPQDTARGMFFNGVLDAVRAELGDAAAERCRQASGEKRFVDFFSYPIVAFLKMNRVALELMAPQHGSPEAALRHIGRQNITDFFSSAAGKTLLVLAGTDARRVMSNAASAFKTAVSYGERTMVWTGATSGRLEMRRDFPPVPYEEGLLTGTLELMGVKNVYVKGRRVGVVDADYEMSWELPAP